MALDTQDLTAIRNIFNDACEELILPRFDQIDERFEKVDERFEKIDERFETLEGRADNTENSVTSLAAKIDLGFAQVNTRFDKLEASVGELSGRLEAVESDIKEIYAMIAKFEHGVVTDKKFAKYSLEKKLLTLNAELLVAAKQAGVVLPR